MNIVTAVLYVVFILIYSLLVMSDTSFSSLDDSIADPDCENPFSQSELSGFDHISTYDSDEENNIQNIENFH